MAEDVVRIDERLKEGITGNVLWEMEECQITDDDFHFLLFGRQISDRTTITTWFNVQRMQSPTCKWMGEELVWNFLPANLSRSFGAKNTHFLRRLCPNKDLDKFSKAKVFFVPLNLGEEWHWHILAIDNKTEIFYFYDS